MQNIKDLRDSLVENYELLKSKQLSTKEAKEMANHAGKIMNSVSIELKYQQQHGTKKKIDFLEYENI